MNDRDNHPGKSGPNTDPTRFDEAAIRAVLEQSRRDIAEGRTVPLEPVLDRMRATAKRIRRERAASAKADLRRG